MIDFKSLFGVERHHIRKICVITPILYKDILRSLGIDKLSKANLYSCGSKGSLTLIHSQIGAPFAGDAVLYLKDTPCENIVLFGSCGLVKRGPSFDIGSLLLINKCLSFESFSSLLKKKNKATTTKSDPLLLKRLLKMDKQCMLQEANCATFGSLKLEEDFMGQLVKAGINALDMECSAVFNAAASIGKKAVALFFATDILKEKHFLRKFTQKEKVNIHKAIDHGISLIKDLATAV